MGAEIVSSGGLALSTIDAGAPRRRHRSGSVRVIPVCHGSREIFSIVPMEPNLQVPFTTRQRRKRDSYGILAEIRTRSAGAPFLPISRHTLRHGAKCDD